MVKNVVSTIIAAALIIAGGIAENVFIEKTFSELTETYTQIQTRIKDGVCTEEEMIKAQETWFKHKERLHVFIPHTEIKEVDLWVAECVAYVADKNYEEAAAKTVVILSLLNRIPQTFSIRTGYLL